MNRPPVIKSTARTPNAGSMIVLSGSGLTAAMTAGAVALADAEGGALFDVVDGVAGLDEASAKVRVSVMLLRY